MKRIDNPPNPYVSTHHEWLEPPPRAMPEVYEERARSILAENDSPDIGFRWSVNPYRGCQHACAYCYARRTHEYLGWGAGTDFETRLTVKVNAPELLRKELGRPSMRGELIAFSGVTDCYQPLEAVWELTRRCLEVCHEFRNPAGVVTKSYLIARDAELLAAMARGGGMRVMMSIPFADDGVAKLIEPQAPPPSKRFEAMRLLADAGTPVSVMMAPIIPGLNDRQIDAVLSRAAECGARSASYQALRLPGSVRDVFLARLREAMPLAADRVESRIRDMRGGSLNDSRFGDRMRGQGEYWQSVEKLFAAARRKHGLDRKPTPCIGPMSSSGMKEFGCTASTPRRDTQMTFGFAGTKG